MVLVVGRMSLICINIYALFSTFMLTTKIDEKEDSLDRGLCLQRKYALHTPLSLHHLLLKFHFSLLSFFLSCAREKIKLF